MVQGAIREVRRISRKPGPFFGVANFCYDRCDVGVSRTRDTFPFSVAPPQGVSGRGVPWSCRRRSAWQGVAGRAPGGSRDGERIAAVRPGPQLSLLYNIFLWELSLLVINAVVQISVTWLRGNSSEGGPRANHRN
ncbi:unnamed protein product, partial [Iphiclides podalirius]